MRDRNIAAVPNFRKLLSKSGFFSRKNSYLSINAVFKQQHCCYSNRSIAVTSRPIHWRPRPVAHKSPTNSLSITNIGRRVLHDTCYTAHQFQGQRSRSQARIVCTPHLCLFLIRETKCCTCVIRGRRGIRCRPNPSATLLVIYLRQDVS